jgi:hypothetical protein
MPKNIPTNVKLAKVMWDIMHCRKGGITYLTITAFGDDDAMSFLGNTPLILRYVVSAVLLSSCIAYNPADIKSRLQYQNECGCQ